MKKIILDTLFDSVKLLPFLFLAFLLIELMEHKFSNKTKQMIEKSGKFGPLLGSSLGIFPQCGFSVVATNFYITRIISLGTLIAIYLSTSDEMLPILLSKQVPITTILKIIGMKWAIGILFGYCIDFFLKKKKSEIKIQEICDDTCDCKHHLLLATLKHTIKTLLFILITNFILNTLMHSFGEDFLAKVLLKNSIFSPFITSLIGLIPNCASSVILTELYLNNTLSFGAMLSGLLSCSGVAMLILWKENKNKGENVKIFLLTYLLAVIAGIIIDIISKML